jgi:hypothetical protein
MILSIPELNSLVGFTAMPDCNDLNKMRAIVDRIKDPIMSYSDPPSIPRSGKLPAAGRPWIVSQLSKGVNYSYSDSGVQELTSFCAERASSTS